VIRPRQHGELGVGEQAEQLHGVLGSNDVRVPDHHQRGRGDRPLQIRESAPSCSGQGRASDDRLDGERNEDATCHPLHQKTGVSR
jgi:hypothetical protein